ncbi:hypothetical protein TRFO_11593 [Tritrichomonas foetus]|uniref:Uncharacterized protein n=1 Tax=Tritrichomonas foetus TaxID=1144522 RepID=A0A1J4J6I8_9EUKA|nr:hypothetical protein TRFO_11593 [Tritrichomonas foetus]|eukprot:OHS93783.1 hypothetical protein TRFO_11593 [Tritrichomonas foetus]
MVESLKHTLKKYVDLSNETYYFPEISPRSKQELSHEYGAMKGLTFQKSDFNHPPGPDFYINRAGDYLDREKSKGFMTMYQKDDFTREVSRNQYMQAAQSKKVVIPQKISSIQEICEEEPFQRFWLHSNTVKKSIQKIKELPYFVFHDSGITISQFIEGIASYVRILKHEKKIENPNLTKTENNQIMHDFITKANEILHKVIQFAINNGLVNIEKLSDKIKENYTIPSEFLENKDSNLPNKDTNLGFLNDKDFESKLFTQYSRTDEFPPCYRVDTSYLNGGPYKKREVHSQLKVLSEMTSQKMNESSNLSSSLNIPPIAQSAPPKSPRQIPGYTSYEDFVLPFTKPNTRCRPRIIENADFNKMKKKQLPSPKKSVRSEKLSRKDMLKEGWKTTELLPRSGDYINGLDSLHSIIKNFDFEYNGLSGDVDIKMPFPLTPEKQDGPNLVGKIWTTAQLNKIKSNENEPMNTPKLNENLTLDDQKLSSESNSHDSNSNYSVNKSENEFADVNKDGNDHHGYKSATIAQIMNGTDNVKLLKQFALDDDDDDDLSGNAFSNKLEKIWDTLGFSPKQKLVMLVKYTETTEKSADLDDALNMWDTAMVMADKYEHIYQELKNFIRFEAKISKHREIILDQMKNELKTAEDAVLNSATQLLKEYQDEMIYRRQPISTVIENRHSRLKILCESEGLVF